MRLDHQDMKYRELRLVLVTIVACVMIVCFSAFKGCQYATDIRVAEIQAGVKR